WVENFRKIAVAYLANVVESDKNNAEAYYLLGLANNNLKKRVELLATAYALNPKNEIYKEDAYWAQILLEDKVELFNKYLQEYSSGLYVEDAKAYLEFRKEAARLTALANEKEREDNRKEFLAIK